MLRYIEIYYEKMILIKAMRGLTTFVEYVCYF